MSIILPMIAILSVTSEWSQRTGLTSFTLVPHRSRIGAKAIGTVGRGGSMALALTIGALGNLLGSAISGVDTRGTCRPRRSPTRPRRRVGMLIGFMLGVLTRNSAGAIVGYFGYSFVVPTLSMVLAANQAWFEKAQPWVDFSFNQNRMYDGGFTWQDWTQFALTGSVWLALPLAFGFWRVLRAEVK